MKLKRLIIHGFKSFKERTTINFDTGITGIVGPNGCGKSNIVDALFWVMGEQSAKHLRGNNMKDVIFSGSSKYKPGVWAEASLILENTEGKHIHIGNKVSSPTEIELTRKLYRNGETEYRINKAPCRLKDIQEVFMDTGAGAKSYSIIAQGEINKLVQAKPQERRTMIEEVAGITKFKLRKKESLKKIDLTQSNLDRLNDLQVEIEKNLKSLQAQAQVASRARSLKDKIKRSDLINNSHKVFDLLKNLRDGKIIHNEKSIELENFRLKKSNLELSLEEERYTKDEQTEKIDGLSLERNEVSKNLAAAEERLNNLNNNIELKTDLLETRKNEVLELDKECKERALKKSELEEKLEEIQLKNQEESDFSELEEMVENLRAELELKKSTQQNDKDALEELSSEEMKLNQTVFQNNSKLEEYSSTLQDTTAEIEALEEEFSGASSQMQQERETVKNLEEKLSHTESEYLETKELVAGLENKVKENGKILKEKSKLVISLESKLTSLKEIANSFEGSKEGVAKILEHDEMKNEFFLLGNSIQCEKEYTNAVQKQLNDYMEVIVSNDKNSSKIIDWSLENKNNGFDFLELDVLNNENMTGSETLDRLKVLLGQEKIKPLEEIVTFSKESDGNLSRILNGHFLVENLSEDCFLKLSTNINFKSLVSFDGKCKIQNLKDGKLLSTYGDDNTQNSIIERNNKISSMSLDFEQENALLSQLEESCNKEEQELLELKNKFDSLRDEFFEVKADFAAKKSSLDSKAKGLESGNTRLNILKNRKTETSKLRLALMESEEVLLKKEKTIKEAIIEKEELLGLLNENIQDQTSLFEEKKEELLTKQVEAKGFEDKVKQMSSQIDDVQDQLEKLQVKMNSGNELIEKYSDELENMSADIDSLEESNTDLVEDLSNRDDTLSLLKDTLSELLLSMQEREDEVKTLSGNINKYDKQITEMGLKLEQYLNEEEEIVKNIIERYQIDLRSVLGKFLEFNESDFEGLHDISSVYFIETEEGQKEIKLDLTYEFTRRYGNDLKESSSKYRQYKAEYGKLGEINWQAIEDYERQKLRFDFLKIQEDELKKSLLDLSVAIDQIDEKSRERFKLAFEEVNSRFQKVFPIIFGGGSATLQVVGDIDSIDCGVDIIASPPGKKMQNINLMSGGEKAMTAVSLIFSIFLVKPSPFCLLDEVDAPLDDANVGRFNELLREMSQESQFILITHNKKTMELNDTLYGVTMQEPGVSSAVSVQLH